MFRKVSKSVVVKMENNYKLFNLNKKVVSKLKDSLTFDNPAYVSAVRYARNKDFIRIPPYITYYNSFKDHIEVPIGFDLDSLGVKYIVKDKRIETPANFPKFGLSLREDQVIARDNFIKNNKSSNINGVVVMPTGKGKSILGLSLASHYNYKTLVIVHKDDLVVGWKKDIELCFGSSFKSGLIKAKKRDIQDITIATIQTLNRLNADEIEELSNTFGMVILDECHHCPASSYDFLGYLKPKIRLGLTATPERSDGLRKLINLHFGGFSFKYNEYIKTIDKKEEDILPVKVIPIESGIHYDPVYRKRGHSYLYIANADLDYSNPAYEKLKKGLVRYSEIPYDLKPRLNFLGEGGLDNAVVTYPFFKHRVCSDIFYAYKNGSNSVVFFTQKAHIDLYYDYLISMEIPESAIQRYYGDSKLTSEQAIKNAESGDVRITLTTYAKGTEGTNVKSWDTAFLVSSLNNGKNVEQAIGRVRRIKEGKRKYAEVFDYYHLNVVILKRHAETRLARYKKLGFKFYGCFRFENVKTKGMFSRGYKR